MRKILSVVLLLAVIGGAAGALWTWKHPFEETVTSYCLVEEKTWVDRKVTQVMVSLSGADVDGLRLISGRIGTWLRPFDSQMRETVIDTPEARVNLRATLPVNAVFPLRELAQKAVDEASAREAPASMPVIRKRTKSAKRPTAATRKTVVDNKKLRDVRKRKDALMRAWTTAEREHRAAMDSRKTYRHPQKFLQRDADAAALKRKMLDLEMTLAEAIDHYTPEHPRIRDLHHEIAAVRSQLDRRMLVAEQDVQSDWKRRLADFQKKKRILDREEKSAVKTVAVAPAPVEATEEVSESPETPMKIAGVSMDWAETETVVKELAMTKRLDGGNVAIGLLSAAAALAIIGYLFGVLGFAGSGSAATLSPDSAATDMGETDIIPGDRPEPKPRKPLPPIEAPPPPAAQRNIDEADLPGRPWLAYPDLPKVEKGLPTVFAPTSAHADFFAKAAASLREMMPQTDTPKIITVASFRSGAGTSTLAANLAVAISASQPTLLVDMHHTAPGLHTMFSIKPEGVDLMAATSWSQAMTATPVEGLSLLPMFSPHLEKEMTSLKLKKKIQAFLKENSSHRMVIIDIAPVGRSDIFEEVAEVSDAFLLILGPEATPYSARQIMKAVDKSMKKKLLLRVQRVPEPLPGRGRTPESYEFVDIPS